jgi:hypothetical protein
MNNQITRDVLYVDSGASKGLMLIYKIFKVLNIIAIIIGIIMLAVGVVSDDMGFIFITNGVFVIVSSLMGILFLQFLNSLVKRTRASEYYIATIEKMYTISE